MLWSLVVGYLGLCGFVYAVQDSLTFFPARALPYTPANARLEYRDLNLRAADGVAFHGWLVEHPNPAGWVLHCHGNGGNIAGRIDHLRLFHSLGFNGVVFDYRGEGKPSEAGLVADATAVWKHLTEELKVSPDKIVLFGESLGGGVACALAAEHRPAGLVLKSTFSSLPDVAARHYPYLPARLLMKTRFPSAKRVAEMDCPKLVCHGPADEVVPFDLGRRLFEKAAGPKEFLELPGGHNTSPLDLGEEFHQTLNRFMRAAVKAEDVGSDAPGSEDG